MSGTTSPTSSLLRSRWAAIGAAVAVTIGVGGVGLVEATVDSGNRPVLVQIEPCRLVDTRMGSGIGDQQIPITPAHTDTFDAHGTNGNCTIPTGATGLSLNVTAIGASERTNLRIFPADASLPLTSNLNPEPGTPPIPNSVTTGLDADGRFSVFNEFGFVNVVIDVNGYYEDHNHDDRYVRNTDLMWAVVDGDGELERSSPGVESAELLPTVPNGRYAVVFDRDISQCAYQATVGRPGVNVNPLPGFAQVANWADDPTSGVIVFTKDQDGVATETRGFHLTVFCGAEFNPPVGL